MAMKVWGSSDWTQPLSPSTRVGIADDDVGAGPEKPKWIYVWQTVAHPPVRAFPQGQDVTCAVLLTIDEARALRDYLIETVGTLDLDAQIDRDMEEEKRRRARTKARTTARTRRTTRKPKA